MDNAVDMRLKELCGMDKEECFFFIESFGSVRFVQIVNMFYRRKLYQQERERERQYSIYRKVWVKVKSFFKAQVGRQLYFHPTLPASYIFEIARLIKSQMKFYMKRIKYVS